MARESDLLFFSFPQGDGHARLYFCFPTHQRSRFAGRDGPQRFLSDCKLGCLEGVARSVRCTHRWALRDVPGQDSRAPHPLAEGVVLIGDAAGVRDPLQGQGLAMALHDAHDVSAALLSYSSPASALIDYAAARAV